MKKILNNSSILTPTLDVDHAELQNEQQQMQDMEATRRQIQEQFLNRVNHPMMTLSEEQKISMGIEMTLGAGFALSEIGHPLGPVFVNDAAAMSQAYADKMAKSTIQ